MPNNEKIFEQSREYYAKLKNLNESVSDLIKQQVNVHPFINLTPIFYDYEKYLYNLDQIYRSNENNVKVEKEISTTALPALPTNPSIFTRGFKFDLNDPITKVSMLGSNSNNKDCPFNNNNSDIKSFSFDKDESPKADFTSVAQEHIYSVHCNVFIGEDGEFNNCGAGNLYLKPILGRDEIQLIVHADLSGNLLCQFILSSDMYMEIFKDQYVKVAGLPTPDSKSSHFHVLFRVESAEKAIELLKTLEKHKKSSSTVMNQETKMEEVKCNDKKEIFAKSNEYYTELRSLNENFSSWVKKHVDAYSCFSLKPIFCEYKEQYNQLEKTYKSNKKIVNIKEEKIGKNRQKRKYSESSVASAVTSTITSTVLQPSSSTSGTQDSTFGNVATDSFSKGPSFGETTSQQNKQPKVDCPPLVKGNIYSIGCIIYVKKIAKYNGHSGKLYLKPVLKTDKVRLIVRSDTNLGNILCNLILTSTIPIQRKGYNYVMLISLPTPDSEPPPVPIYFRVESPEKADELFKTLEKYIKSNVNFASAVNSHGSTQPVARNKLDESLPNSR